MNKQLIAHLRAKHESAAACLTLIKNETDADKKNIAQDFYESLLIDIIEMQVPENEKPEYHSLNMEEYNEDTDWVFNDDYSIADMEERLRPKIRVALHEEIKVPSIAHNI